MENRLYQINLLGKFFSVQTDENPERMKKIISILERKTDIVKNDLSVKDPLKNLVISSIMIIDELLKEKDKTEDSEYPGSEEVERLTLQIMERIDKSLE